MLINLINDIKYKYWDWRIWKPELLGLLTDFWIGPHILTIWKSGWKKI